jgi:threonine synthase
MARISNSIGACQNSLSKMDDRLSVSSRSLDLRLCRPSTSSAMCCQGVPNDTQIAGTFVTHLECSLSGERYEADKLQGLSASGKPLLVRYDLEAVGRVLTREILAQRPPTLWKWRELLPVRRYENCVTLGEWATPIVCAHTHVQPSALARAHCSPRAHASQVSAPKIAAELGVSAGGGLWVKDEGRLPTGSFKARGLVMAVSMAKELGVTRMAMPTNGNAGAAMSAYCSRCGMDTFIFAPEVWSHWLVPGVDDPPLATSKQTTQTSATPGPAGVCA